MEFPCFQVHIYLKMGILLLFLAVTAPCECSSSVLRELGSSDSKFDANYPALHFPQKYITEAYLEKLDSLPDLDFQDFIARELPNGSCKLLQDEPNIVPKLSVLRRHLIGEGSHRRLSLSIRFRMQQESFSELPFHFCEVIIVERLPSGVFADPFELQHLMQRGVFADASAFGDTNLELPSMRSNRSIVEVHMDAVLNMSLGINNEVEINIDLPLHARYPPLGEHGYSRVEFGSPDLFTRCIAHTQSCIFVSPVTGVSPIVWKVPCGIKEHARFVSTLSFVSAIVSAFLIVLASGSTGRVVPNNLNILHLLYGG